MKRVWRVPLLRWLAALAWTGLVLFFMVLPGSTPAIHNTSAFFGGTDLSDAIGHVILFGTLALLWHGALVLRMSPARSYRYALWLVLLLAISTEFAQQFVPRRGASLLDMAANLIGVALAAWWLRRRMAAFNLSR